MLNFDEAEPHVFEIVDAVVQELPTFVRAGSQILVIGAQARDIIHSALGHRSALRSTDDLDLAIVVSDWDHYLAIIEDRPAIGQNGIRFRIAGFPVDIMPFGGVEQPKGTVTPPPRVDGMNVFGFEAVRTQSAEVLMPSGDSVRIPQPAGYAALKLRAWLDRAPIGIMKDAGDIAVALYWYSESPEVSKRLYDSEDTTLLERYDWDPSRAAGALLGSDIATLLGAVDGTALAQAWGAGVDEQRLARELHLTGTEVRLDERLGVLAALQDGLSSSGFR
ncbi:Predicted nucleotidyltransferase [Plantibacter flavus]|uniref:Putative nucleotidyltransferase n=1 Tax=Plantibacter flavus TaxID=150123 RepID=A0A3N2C6X7_9MICO|nr:hypothetical protein [Plantibacter flavus]ROR83160.1 putative nucleotidyltransferase [Plantibacter flavus]SMG45965.1 Predicted nucleotidyltransferase [Plantibacter flavus]